VIFQADRVTIKGAGLTAEEGIEKIIDISSSSSLFGMHHISA